MSIRTDTERSGRTAVLIDLGLQGARLELDEALVPGVDVIVELRAPTLWDPLTLTGRVAWAKWDIDTHIAQVGVHFEHRSPAALFALFELLGSQGFDA